MSRSDYFLAKASQRSWVRVAAAFALIVATLFVPLAAPLEAGTMYAGDTDGKFFTVDPVTGAVIDISTTPLTGMAGLAWDTSTNTMYGAMSVGDNRFFSIDRATGAVSVIATLAMPVSAMAYDPSTNTLYGGNEFGQFFTIDRATGAETSIGTIPVTGMRGMDFDTSTNTLYAGMSSGDNRFFTINPATGAVAMIATLAMHVESMAYDPSTDTLYGGNELGQFFTIDRATGAETLLSYDPPLRGMRGLAYVPEPSSLVLVVLGTAVICCALWRRRAGSSAVIFAPRFWLIFARRRTLMRRTTFLVTGLSALAGLLVVAQTALSAGLSFYHGGTGAYLGTDNITLVGGPDFAGRAESSLTFAEIAGYRNADLGLHGPSGLSYYNTGTGAYLGTDNVTLIGGPFAGRLESSLLDSEIAGYRNADLGLHGPSGLSFYNGGTGAYLGTDNTTLMGGPDFAGRLQGSLLDFEIIGYRNADLALRGPSGISYYHTGTGAYLGTDNVALVGGPDFAGRMENSLLYSEYAGHRGPAIGLIVPIPEPSSLLLAALGTAALGCVAWRKKRGRQHHGE